MCWKSSPVLFHERKPPQNKCVCNVPKALFAGLFKTTRVEFDEREGARVRSLDGKARGFQQLAQGGIEIRKLKRQR